MSFLESDPWGDSPFYRPDQLPLGLPVVQATTTHSSVDQKTLEEWHYRLTSILDQLRSGGDPVPAERDLEDLNSELQTYLRG